MRDKGGIFIFSGPSGCGKSTVLSRVMARLEHPYFSVSATTRAPRKGETDGVDYLFISREDFLAMIEADEFLEYAQYIGNYYGTPRSPVMAHAEAGDDVILDIEVQGAAQVMAKLPEAVSVFIAPPSLEELERRLRGRSTETEEKIQSRLKRAAEELPLSVHYNYTVINDEIDRAVDEILAIIESSHTERNETI